MSIEEEFKKRVKIKFTRHLGWCVLCVEPFFSAVVDNEKDATKWAEQEFKKLYKGGE